MLLVIFIEQGKIILKVMNSVQKLEKKNSEGKFICIGLDTDISKLPKSLKREVNPVVRFNKAIIDATAENVAAYKLNFAFSENSFST